MEFNKERTAMFSGHRILPAKKIERIVKRLDAEIDELIAQGVDCFISGGAVGFDQICASLIIVKKQQGKSVKLVFALPCKNQELKWTDKQKSLYHSLLLEADDIIFVSDEFSDDCMKLRNYFMVDNANFCICALTNPASGTGQTVRCAEQKGLQIINVAK